MWLSNNRPVGELWENAPISEIKGAGGKKGETLISAGIATAKELQAISDDDLPALNALCLGISVDTLKKRKEIPSHHGTCLHTKVDYRTAANPYLTKYGVERWQ